MPEFNGPQKDEVEMFFEEEALRQQSQEELELTTNRMAVFLTERGVELYEPLAAKGEPPTIDAVMRQIEAAARHSMLVYVAARIGAISAILRVTGDVARAESSKLDLQAGLVAEGFDQHWLEAVNAELPGPTLDHVRDAELIKRKADELADHKAMISATGNQIRDRFREVLAFADGEMSTKDWMALERLVGAYGKRQASPYHRLRTAWSEEARILLLDTGIELTPRWQRLIEYEDRRDER